MSRRLTDEQLKAFYSQFVTDTPLGRDGEASEISSVVALLALSSESLHKFLQGLRIDPRRLMSKLLHVLNVRPRIDSGIAVGAALTAQFQHT